MAEQAPHFYYFGCLDRPGHFLHQAPGSPSIYYEQQPWDNLDGGLQPKGPEIEGRALVHHKDGWTAVSFWDRSVDKRGRCNSNFLASGTFTFDQMMEMARENFPRVIGLFKFAVTDATEGGAP